MIVPATMRGLDSIVIALLDCSPSSLSWYEKEAPIIKSARLSNRKLYEQKVKEYFLCAAAFELIRLVAKALGDEKLFTMMAGSQEELADIPTIVEYLMDIRILEQLRNVHEIFYLLEESDLPSVVKAARRSMLMMINKK